VGSLLQVSSASLDALELALTAPPPVGG
jgi:hypothetical protein